MREEKMNGKELLVDKFIGCKIIAEMGASHQQSFQKALAIIWAAADVGADAVKVQMFIPDDMTLPRDDENFKIKKGLWAGHTLYELYEKACYGLSSENRSYCRGNGH